MKLSLKGFITCKEAEAYSDCADHYAYNMAARRFAISDGVTKSFFPKIWSRILVEQSVALDGATDLPLEQCQGQWLEEVTQRVSEPDVKWFTQNAFLRRDPGLATFVSLVFDEDNLVWTAQAQGDSFLFFVPEYCEDDFDKWLKFSSKPEPVVFDNFPDYLSSRGKGRGEMRELSGYVIPGTFYLMTDALAEFLFSEKKEALRIIEEEWTSQKAFEASVERLRHAGRLHNDDSAVLAVTLEDDGIFDICDGDVQVTDLEELVEAEKAYKECCLEIEATYKRLNDTVTTLLNNYNLSDHVKYDIQQQLIHTYSHAHREPDCDVQ